MNPDQRWSMLGPSLLSLMLTAQEAVAASGLPTGAAVVAGQADISVSNGAMSIDQSSAKAIIDWSSFSIGRGSSVQFNNGSGATLNRVQSGAPMSLIEGGLTASGSVYLINPSGVIVGQRGVVHVGGSFVASTQDLADDAFMTGGSLAFAGNSDAAVVNLGKIGALGGDVVLVAAHVKNSGQITAPAGSVGLLAGYQVRLKDQADADGKFIVELGGSGTSATNTSVIAATAAELRAQNGNVYALAGNTAGVIKATELTGAGGDIRLTAPGGGVQVAANAVLDASATTTGDGGHIVVNGATTVFSGTARARGGSEGGKGGLVETSGDRLSVDGARIDTTAPQGATGQWLLDPYDVTISSDPTSQGALAAGSFTPSGDSSVINASTLATALATTSVIIATGAYGGQGGEITVASPVSWNSNYTLVLNAAGNINVNAAITAPQGELSLNAGLNGSGLATQASGPNAAITVAHLNLYAPSVALINPANAIGAVDGVGGGPKGNLALTTSGPLTVAGLSGFSAVDITASGAMTVTYGVSNATAVQLSTGGNFTIAPGGSVKATGNVTIKATGNFINQGDGSAVSGAPWLIYSANPSGDTFGGLDSGNTAIWNTAAGAPVAASGNRYVFAYQPTATFSSTNDSKPYSTDATAQIQSDFSVSGLQPAVVGAYKADTLASAFAGAPSLSSAGADGSATVLGGPYPITISNGTLVSSNGYALAFNSPGLLTVNPGPIYLNWSVADAQSTYGTLATVGVATLSGVQSVDLGNVVGTVQVFEQPTSYLSVVGGAPPSNPPIILTARTYAGSYQEMVTGLTGSAASNYTLAGTGNRVGTLTINPLPVTAYLAGVVDKTYDGTNVASLAAGNYGVSGVLNGDTVSLYAPNSGTYDSKDVGSGKTVSVSGLSIYSGGSPGIIPCCGIAPSNYVLASSSLSAPIGQIDPKPLPVTIGVNAKIYDGNTSATGAAALGLATPPGIDSTSVPGAGLTSNSGASGSLFVSTGGVSANPYAPFFNTGGGSINFSASPVINVYLTTGPSVQLPAVQSNGVVTGDHVGLSTATYAFLDKNVGVQKGVRIFGLHLTGPDAADYDMQVGANVLPSILPKTLTAGLSGIVEKTYDGTATASLSPSNYGLSGAVSGDNIALLAPSLGLYDNANAGASKLVSVGSLKLTGADAGNYVLASSGLSAPVGVIDPRPVTIAADSILITSAQLDPPLTYSITAGNFVGGDSAVGGLARQPGSAPGVYDIGRGTLQVPANYNLTFLDGLLTVIAAPAPAPAPAPPPALTTPLPLSPAPVLTTPPAPSPTYILVSDPGGGGPDGGAPYKDNQTVSDDIRFDGTAGH